MALPNHEELLEKTYKLAVQNNKMLRGMKRAAFWGTIFKLIFWAIALGIPVYLYFTFFQPILTDLLNTYAQIQATGAQIQGQVNSLPIDQLQDLLENIPGVDFAGTSQ